MCRSHGARHSRRKDVASPGGPAGGENPKRDVRTGPRREEGSVNVKGGTDEETESRKRTRQMRRTLDKEGGKSGEDGHRVLNWSYVKENPSTETWGYRAVADKER